MRNRRRSASRGVDRARELVHARQVEEFKLQVQGAGGLLGGRDPLTLRPVLQRRQETDFRHFGTHNYVESYGQLNRPVTRRSLCSSIPGERAKALRITGKFVSALQPLRGSQRRSGHPALVGASQWRPRGDRRS